MAWLSPFPIPARRRAVSPIVTAGDGRDGGHLNHKDRLFLAALEFLPLPLLPLTLHRKNHPLSFIELAVATLLESPSTTAPHRPYPSSVSETKASSPPLATKLPALPGENIQPSQLIPQVVAMASPANRMSHFTITQPFLGAPLHFQPALGSQQLEALIDAYVAGPASKQDKLSEVTIDFYNHATVDLTNGSLVRRYEVIVPSRVAGQSPTQSQSSGFSPIYTPSPGSSATFGDSGNASASMTPPNRCRHSRVSKKAAKKETKRAAELRLPGFSIMTKDGVDVTSSAGRGTKTKEQREHAHMMRIMKACEDCKRKKVRVSVLPFLSISSRLTRLPV